LSPATASAANAIPNATQAANRWHLMENVSRAFLDAVRKSMRQIRAAIGTGMIASVGQDPAPLRLALDSDSNSHLTKTLTVRHFMSRAHKMV
jgi:hypothetical protein